MVSFVEYGPAERQQIEAAILSLPVNPGGRAELPGVCQPIGDAWCIGDASEILPQVHDVTSRTKNIAEEFLRLPQGDPSRKVGFYWKVEQDNSSPSVLWIDLCLLSAPPKHGLLILAQQVLRVTEEEYIYWGVD